jgi:hypothetical protein
MKHSNGSNIDQKILKFFTLLETKINSPLTESKVMNHLNILTNSTLYTKQKLEYKSGDHVGASNE